MILHLQQASMTWRDTDREVTADYNRILARDADFVGFTEVYRDLDILKRAAERHGYKLAWGPTKSGKAETVVACGKGVRILKSDSILVNPADSGRPPAGGHSARYATWVLAEVDGQVVVVVEGHWVTAAGEDPDRREKRREMSQVCAGLIAEHADSTAIGFVMGDTNEDDNPNDRGSVVYGPLEAAGLETIFDELRVYPVTHPSRHGDGSTIDIIASYVPDVRVEAVRLEVHRDNSQHHQVSGFYRVADRGQSPRKHACPKCGVIHRPTQEDTP